MGPCGELRPALVTAGTNPLECALMPRKAGKKKSKPRARAAGRPAGKDAPADDRLRLTPFQAAWVDSVIASIREAGGPAFTREQVLHAVVDAALGQKLAAASIRTTDDLRRAFGGLDLSSVERMLKERPRIESGLLKALEDSIK